MGWENIFVNIISLVRERAPQGPFDPIRNILFQEPYPQKPEMIGADPTGLVIGAIAIVLIILLSVLLFPKKHS